MDEWMENASARFKLFSCFRWNPRKRSQTFQWLVKEKRVQPKLKKLT